MISTVLCIILFSSRGDYFKLLNESRNNLKKKKKNIKTEGIKCIYHKYIYLYVCMYMYAMNICFVLD